MAWCNTGPQLVTKLTMSHFSTLNNSTFVYIVDKRLFRERHSVNACVQCINNSGALGKWILLGNPVPGWVWVWAVLPSQLLCIYYTFSLVPNCPQSRFSHLCFNRLVHLLFNLIVILVKLFYLFVFCLFSTNIGKINWRWWIFQYTTTGKYLYSGKWNVHIGWCRVANVATRLHDRLISRDLWLLCVRWANKPSGCKCPHFPPCKAAIISHVWL